MSGRRSRTDSAQTPKSAGSAEAPAGDAKAPEHAPAREFETVKLDDGSEIQFEKYGNTYPAYEYRPPLDILDRAYMSSSTASGTGAPAFGHGTGDRLRRGLALLVRGPERPAPIGRVMRSRLNGTV